MANSPVKAAVPLSATVSQENMASPEKIKGGKDDGDEKAVPDSARSEAAEIDQTIGQPIGRVEEVGKEPPTAEHDESIAHNHVQRRRDRLGEKSKPSVGLGAVEGEEIVKVHGDDPTIDYRADEEEQAEKTNVMSLVPDFMPCPFPG